MSLIIVYVSKKYTGSYEIVVFLEEDRGVVIHVTPDREFKISTRTVYYNEHGDRSVVQHNLVKEFVLQEAIQWLTNTKKDCGRDKYHNMFFSSRVGHFPTYADGMLYWWNHLETLLLIELASNV